MYITNRSRRFHLHHRWKLIYLHRAIVLPMMEDLSKHSAKKNHGKMQKSIRKLTYEFNE